MKQIFLFLLALLLCQSTYAQNSTLSAHPDIKQKLRHSFTPLDKTQVPGGYLLNQTTPFVSPTLFHGITKPKNHHLQAIACSVK